MASTGIPLLPPAEAIAFFRKKGFKVGFAWQDVWQEEHAHAFTVAKAMSADVLQTIRTAVDDAIANGRTLEQFRAGLTPLLQQLGWWGRQRMIDPATGQAKSVQLGSPRRLKIIYDMNLRMARAAGLWAKVQRTKSALPYLRYTAVMDERTRPEHAEWHGTILPVDDPWWDAHYPPCGWNCRCTVIQLDAGTIEDRGWSISDEPPPVGTPRPWTNPRTGETIDVPAGIDPGFGYNVGKSPLTGITPPPLLPRDLPDLEPGLRPGGPAPGAPGPAGMLPEGIGEQEAVDAFLDELAGLPEPTIGAPLASAIEPVADLTGTELAAADAQIPEIRQAARDWLFDHREPVARSDLDKIHFGRAGIKKGTMILPGDDEAARLLATPAVRKVIADGTMRAEPNYKPETKPDVLEVGRIIAPINLGNSVWDMEVVVERQRNGWWYHGHTIKAPSGRPVRSGGVSTNVGQGGARRLVDPKSGDRSTTYIASTVPAVEDRIVEDASGWPLAIGGGWFRNAAGDVVVPGGDRRRVLRLVGRAIARPDQIRLRWVTGADGTPQLFRRYLARVDGLAIVVDVGKTGWRFATERDPGFDWSRLAVGAIAWTAPASGSVAP